MKHLLILIMPMLFSLSAKGQNQYSLTYDINGNRIEHYDTLEVVAIITNPWEASNKQAKLKGLVQVNLTIVTNKVYYVDGDKPSIEFVIEKAWYKSGEEVNEDVIIWNYKEIEQ